MNHRKIDISGIKHTANRSNKNKKPDTSSLTWDDESKDIVTIIIQDSRIEELFEERKSNMRFYNFVWLYLFFNKNADFEEESIGFKEATFADIEHFFEKECCDWEAKDLAKLIRKYFRKQCIPTDSLNWISSSTRTIKWLKEKITTFDQYNITQFININGLPLIQAILDQWEMRSSFKVNFVRELQKKWESNIKSDHELNWLEDKSHAKERRNLAWHELCEKYDSKFQVNNAPKTHQDILEIFDQLIDEGISKKAFIRSLLSKQSKQKNADNGRKPKNVEILLDNHSKLKELATYWQVPEYVAMDRLISEAFEEALGKESPPEN
jgi:hypothetical protein